MIARATLLLLLAVPAACSTLPEGQRATKPASGPPEVRMDVVEEHAHQFDEEQAVRRAGSQEEFAASAYVVAHLTEAGYVSRLDAVPVQDLVRSTNVVALPPSGEEPEVIVTVAYDSSPGSPPGGLAIGTWLEVARALRAVEPDHSVQFVALGAEHTTVSGGHLGSRRLARQLTDDGRSPEIVVVEAAGSETTGAAEVFEAAGFETRVFESGAAAAGTELLDYLSGL